MAPKRAEQRANRAKAKARAKLSTAWDAGERPQYQSSSSQVSRIGDLRLTDAQGRVTSHGQQLREIARERNEEVSFDPWVRGTELKRQQLYAKRRSGKEQAVAKVLPSGEIVPKGNAGEECYGAFREELMIEIPVYLKEYVKDSTKRNGYNLVSEPTTLTFSEALLENATAAYHALSELRKMRTRDHAPLTENQNGIQWYKPFVLTFLLVRRSLRWIGLVAYNYRTL